MSNERTAQKKNRAGENRFFLPPADASPPRKETLSEEEARRLFNVRNSPQVPVDTPPPPDNKPIQEKDILNYGSRWLEVKQFSGGFGQGVFDARDLARTPHDPTWQDNDLQAGNLIGNGAGLLVGLIGHLLCVRYGWYYTNGALNPFYRNFKTLANVGWSVGTGIAMFLPLPDSVKKFLTPILADVASLVIGLLAVPYILYRRSRKIDPKKNETLWITGTEGWSKFGKTQFVTGTFLGPAISALYAWCDKSPLTNGLMAIVTSIAGVGSFVLGMTLIPLVNKAGKLLGYEKPLLLQAKRIKKENVTANEKLTMENSDPDKDQFRNNYIRSGMQLGNSVGLFFAVLAGAWLFPFWSPMMAMLICGGACAVVAGGIAGITGHRFSAYVKKYWNDDADAENSPDYCMRSGSYILATVGTIVGIACGNMWLGTAIGGILGWFGGIVTVWLPRQFVKKEEKSTCLPWTQRTGSGSMVGSVLGGIIGFGIGLVCGGPFALVSVPLFTAIGSTLGTIIAGLYGKETRTVISKMMEPKRLPEPRFSMTTSYVWNSFRKTSLICSVSQSMSQETTASEKSVHSPTTSPAPVIDTALAQKGTDTLRRPSPAASPVEKKTHADGNTAVFVSKNSFLKNVTAATNQPFSADRCHHSSTARQSICAR